MTFKVHILAFGSHPDDVELSCAGTLINHIKAGHQVAIVDLTRGVPGTRGNASTRAEEAAEASKIMGVQYRENLGWKDGFFKNDEEHQRAVIRMIRKYQPEIILCNATHDRHPDHGRGSTLVSDSCFLSGLRKIETNDENNNNQLPWKPKAVYHYIQDQYLTPSFVVDISGFIDQKMECIRAYKTQFYNPSSNEPVTYISSEEFLKAIYNRAAEMGRLTGVRFAEGFITERIPGIKNLFELF